MAGVRKRISSLLGPRGFKGDKGDVGPAGPAYAKGTAVIDASALPDESGTYSFFSGGLTNGPAGVGAGFLTVRVLGTTNPVIREEVTVNNSRERWTRTRTNGVWSSWIRDFLFDWTDLLNKPLTFPPSAHQHPWSDVTGKPVTFPPSAHTHAWSELTGVPATFAPSAHTHLWADLTDKPATFTPSAHTHLWADVTDKPATFAPSAHSHAQADVTGLSTALADATWAKGSLAAATDWNTLYTPGVYRIANLSTHTNYPPMSGVTSSTNGFLTITNIPGNSWAMQEFSRYATPERWYRVSTNTSGGWSVWVKAPDSRLTTITSGTDVDTLTVPGAYEVTSTSIAPTVINLPVPRPGVFELFRTTNGIVVQRYTTYGADQSIYLRTSLSVTSGTMGAWKQFTGVIEAASPSSEAGLTNDLLVQDFTRRRGGRKRVTTAVVALRFDHGLANFDTKIRPLLEARNLPYSLALCSGQWDRAENVGVTAAMVNSWVTGGLAEVWNHTKDHGSGDGTSAAWKAAILDGLTELRSQIPAAQIDGFVPPGSAGADFGGFTNASTVQQFYGTEGGRFILSNHAVASGYIGGTAQRVMDGVVRQGMSHYTLDQRSLAEVQAQVSAAETGKTGLQLMLHPSLVDTAGYMTTATLTSVLDHIVAERDAGRLRVMGPYDLMLADVV